MTGHQQLNRDINILRESIRLDWQEVDGGTLTASERMVLMRHIKWCLLELNMLLLKFEHLEKWEHRDS